MFKMSFERRIYWLFIWGR